MLPTKFRVNWPFSSEEEGKNRFSRWLPSWISDWNDFSYFYIFKSSRCFLPIFKSADPLVQENKRKKKRVSRWPPWQPSWISDPNNLSYFRSTSRPNASYQVSSQMAFQFRRSEQEAHRPQFAHLSDIATADMQMLCNIFPTLSSQLMKISSFEQFLVLKKNIWA